MMSDKTKWILSVSFILAAVGFFLPFWPLSAGGILLAALSGRWVAALAMGLLLDIAYGAPIGRLHILYFPFTLLAILGALGQYIASKYIRKSPTDTL